MCVAVLIVNNSLVDVTPKLKKKFACNLYTVHMKECSLKQLFFSFDIIHVGGY